MPTVHLYAQQLQTILGSGGVVSSENRVSLPYSIRVLDELRANAIAQYAKAKQIVPEQVYSTTSLVYTDEYQNADDTAKCIYVYQVPAILPVSSIHDGISFVGVRNGENLNRIKSSAVLENYRKHYITKRKITEEPWVLYQPDFSEMMFHKPFGGPTKALVVRAIFVRPTELPEYNIDNDEYPITDEIFTLVLSLAQDTFLRPIMSAPSESVPNGIQDSGMNPSNLQNNNS
jgi:hypothetical protein